MRDGWPVLSAIGPPGEASAPGGMPTQGQLLSEGGHVASKRGPTTQLLMDDIIPHPARASANRDRRLGIGHGIDVIGLLTEREIGQNAVECGRDSAKADLVLEREWSLREQVAQAQRIKDFFSKTMSNLSGRTELSGVIESILVTFAKYLDAAHVFLFRYDPALDTIRLDFSYLEGLTRWGLSGEEMAIWSQPFPSDITPAWRIMCEQRGLFTPSMIPISLEEFGWPGAFEYVRRFGLSDIGHIVLFSGDTAVGSIGFGLRNGRHLQTADKAFIEAVAEQAAVVVRMVDLAEEARRAAVAVEREKAAQQRAAELAKANEALRRSSPLAGRRS